MVQDIHNKSFTEETKTKLLIFKYYLREWLPVFLSRKEIIWPNINIIDFFAGPGYDTEFNEGSPLIILNELSNYGNTITSKGININVIFNEYKSTKFLKLKENIENKEYNNHINIQLENLDFISAFEKYYQDLCNSASANLLFLDQSGIKQITENVFHRIITCKQTDFIFFISSSTINRFAEHPSIQRYLNLSKEEIKRKPYYQVHKSVLDYYKSLINIEEYYLAPFSIKKNANIYGLIFGSSHILGMEKFLKTAWKIDPDRGEANFDIDGENLQSDQYDLFTGNIERPHKIQLYEKELREKILKKELSNNKQIYIYTITHGFLPSHARDVIKNLKSKKLINNSKFGISYDVYKNPELVIEIDIT